MRKPGLFIVGHPRTGTSSLHDYLNQHPEIFMSPIKEPNFFAKDFHAESDHFHHNKRLYFPFRTEKQYLRLYHQWGPEKIAGEASATTLYSKVSAKEIWKFNPTAKIILTLREPVSFLFSYHATAVFSSGETITDFEEALAVEDERRQGKFLSKRVIVPSWLFYSEFIKYKDQVTRFLTTFGRDQIMINIFDDFKKDPQGAYKEILNFLKVDPNFSSDFVVINPYKKHVKWPKLKYYVFDSPLFRKIQRSLFPFDIYARLVKYYMKITLSRTPKMGLDDRLRKKLKSNFKKEVEQISELIGRDLISLWGYKDF